MNRLFGLDLLRFFAIVFVLLSHTLQLGNSSPEIESLNNCFGLFGVEFFFVLSGFLIGGILIKLSNQNPVLSKDVIRSFWIRRWFRTLPNYFLVIIIYEVYYYWATRELIFSLDKNFSYFFFLQNFFNEMPDLIFQTSWSLAVEEWFYLLFPLMLLAMNKFFRKKDMFIIAIVVFISVPLCLRLFLSLSDVRLTFYNGFSKIVPLRLDAITFGVLMAYICSKNPIRIEKIKRFAFITGITALIILFLATYQGIKTKLFLEVFLLPLISISVAMILPVLKEVKCSIKLISRAVTYISLISYSLYLIHFLIIGLMPHIIRKLDLDVSPWTHVLLIWITSIIISGFQYELFEKRVTKLRDYFSKPE